MARWIVGNRLSRIYLVAVVAAIVWAFVSVARSDQPDADLAVLWPLIMSGPGSWLLLVATGEFSDDNDVVFVCCIVAGALLNAVALNAVVAQIRRARASYDVP